MNIFLILSSVFLGLLIFGFLWGMLRSWRKSLLRFGILVIDLIIAIFCSPLIAKAIIKQVAHGTTITIFNFSFDFGDIINDLIGSNITGDMASVETVTNELATGLINVVMNIVVFFLLFIVLWLFSLIIYAIIWAIIKHAGGKGRKEKGEKKHESIWLRLVGGLVGTLSMCVIFFAFAVPVFGAMNICNNFVESEEKKGSAYAAGISSSLICGRPYYKEDEKIGQIETYVEKYSEIKEQYDKSIVGGFCNAMGLSALGGKTFGYLTNVSAGDLKLNFSDELVAVIKTYNAYKDAFVVNQFDIKDNKSVDRLANVYDNLTGSEIINRYVVEILPTMSDKWSNGESFMGVNNPLADSEFNPVVCKLLNVFSVKNSDRINTNVKVLFKLIKVANDPNHFIEAITSTAPEGENIVINYFSDNKTFVRDFINTLSETEEFRNNLPGVFNEVLKVLYDSMVGGVNPIQNLTNDQIAGINWTAEADNMQNVVNGLMEFYKLLEMPEVELAEELGTVGKVIDYARRSQILSESLKSFIVGYIDSENVKFSDDVETNTKIKNELKYHIEKRWSYEENPNFSFETTFRAIAETVKVVNNIASSIGDVSLKDFSNVLKDIVKDEGSKDAILEIVDSSLTDEFIGNNDSAVVIKDIFVDFIRNSSEETVDKDIAAGQKIVEVVKASENNSGLGLDDQVKSDAFVEAITGSDNMMNILKNSSENEGDKLSGMTSDIDEISSNNIKSSAEKLASEGKISESHKNIILNLFK